MVYIIMANLFDKLFDSSSSVSDDPIPELNEVTSIVYALDSVFIFFLAIILLKRIMFDVF